MSYLLLVFQAVAVIFALAAVATGAQAIVDPVGFSATFGLPLHPTRADPAASSYASLMGVRQLATGISLLTFAWQGKWSEAATILAIIGVLVAGTDGVHLARAGHTVKGRWHAVPGACIAALAGASLYYAK